MEAIYNTSDYIEMIFMFVMMVLLLIVIKYIHGDYSAESIEEISKDELSITNDKGDVIGKKYINTYKYTYKNGSIKYKTKTINL